MMNRVSFHASTPVLALREMPALIETFCSQRATSAGEPTLLLVLGPIAARKEQLARLIHAAGSRCDGPFVAVDVPASGFASASHARRAIDSARGGTLLLRSMTGGGSPATFSILAAIRFGTLQTADGARSDAADVQVIAAAEVLWRDARQDETFLVTLPAGRLTEFLAFLGVGNNRTIGTLGQSAYAG